MVDNLVYYRYIPRMVISDELGLFSLLVRRCFGRDPWPASLVSPCLWECRVDWLGYADTVDGSSGSRVVDVGRLEVSGLLKH